jgi:predicted amidohydrolase
MADRRKVTVSTGCFELPDPGADISHITKAGNLAKALGMIAEAAARHSDLMVLPEVFASKHTGLQPGQVAEPVPGGEISQALAQAARAHGLYVAGCLYERADDAVYNTVALFDRTGALVGKYRKVHLAPGEELTARPGCEYPVFETDFGKIGALVCYDLNFPEAARCLALAGAEIILWPTMFSEPRAHYTDVLMRARALENQVWLVSSNYAQPARGDAGGVHIGRSAILDWDGMVLADTGRREGVATATLNLEERGPLSGMPRRLLDDRLPETYAPLVAPKRG